MYSPGSLDEMTVNVEISEGSFFGEIKKHQALIEEIKNRIASSIGIYRPASGARVIDRRSMVG
jgi:hypothetical protein